MYAEGLSLSEAATMPVSLAPLRFSSPTPQQGVSRRMPIPGAKPWLPGRWKYYGSLR